MVKRGQKLRNGSEVTFLTDFKSGIMTKTSAKVTINFGNINLDKKKAKTTILDVLVPVKGASIFDHFLGPEKNREKGVQKVPFFPPIARLLRTRKWHFLTIFDDFGPFLVQKTCIWWGFALKVGTSKMAQNGPFFTSRSTLFGSLTG